MVASAQLILATAVSGWSPNSPATCSAQPRTPSRRSVAATARRIWPGEWDPEGCRVEANSAPARAASNVPGPSYPGSDIFVARISVIVRASLPSASAALLRIAPHTVQLRGQGRLRLHSQRPTRLPASRNQRTPVSSRGRRLPTSVEPQRELDEDQRPFAGRAADLQRSAQGLGPVAQADQAGSAGRIGAARAVVADRQMQATVSLLKGDAHYRSARVPGRVGERLGTDVVGRYLDRLRQPPHRRTLDLDPDPGPPG